MAKYRDYAENLIGDWNTDQYQPQRNVAQALYQTNWEKLQNDYNNYVDTVKRNLDIARTNYYNRLATADANSFARVNSAVENLAKRGLLNSGIANRYIQADTNARGQEVNSALNDIINTNTQFSGKLGDLVNSIAGKENTLNVNLGSTLGNLAAKEQAAGQAYQNLAANIATNAEARDLANAANNAAKKKAQEDDDEAKRRLLIADTLMNDNMSDNEKVRNMAIYLDVPVDTAEAAVKGYNDNQTLDIQTPLIQKYQSKLDDYNNKNNNIRYWKDQTGLTVDAMGDLKYIINRNKLNKAKDKVNGLEYTDLYNLLYGDK